MAAANKEELLNIATKDFARLEKLIDTIDADKAMIKVEDDTSIKDTIGHRLHWIDLFFKWHEDGQAGREVHIPAEGYKWNQLKAYNAKIRDSQADLSWADAKAQLKKNHEKLLDLIKTQSDETLYGGPMIGNDKWTMGRFAEAASASHYRSANKYIRQCLKKIG